MKLPKYASEKFDRVVLFQKQLYFVKESANIAAGWVQIQSSTEVFPMISSWVIHTCGLD